ncbi:AAA family ATPase [Glutamicibacter sp. 287]|uniref:AAA family ATPase n=1 Tax=Glutamicibacter TaxID=1742989 RepID=UPI000BB92144|nr:AAA family ATPase [Glutamicibacter sp. BW80]PCC28487.1 hypothetical protein CIK76_11470 [Glutamicibacter sp. BW80]
MRIAVSGTYGAGKTTFAAALSQRVGIPQTSARGMRELLPLLKSAKRLEDCTPTELIQLGVRRFAERITNEQRLNDQFISDGSSLHEWAYGEGRGKYGMTPGQDLGGVGREEIKFFTETMAQLGMVFKEHAKKSYDVFIHLPIEFPLPKDGHRPVSEGFRSHCNFLLLQAMNDLSIPYIVASGSLKQRLDSACAQLSLEKLT